MEGVKGVLGELRFLFSANFLPRLGVRVKF